MEKLELRIDIPGNSVRAVDEGDYVSRELLQFLAFCSGRELITGDPVSELKYDDYSIPLERTERYGDSEYGIQFQAKPIQSGIGVHGEEGNWEFFGIPEGLSISARTRMDMRGGVGNFYSLMVKSESSRTSELFKFIEDSFAQRIREFLLSASVE